MAFCGGAAAQSGCLPVSRGPSWFRLVVSYGLFAPASPSSALFAARGRCGGSVCLRWFLVVGMLLPRRCYALGFAVPLCARVTLGLAFCLWRLSSGFRFSFMGVARRQAWTNFCSLTQYPLQQWLPVLYAYIVTVLLYFGQDNFLALNLKEDMFWGY